MKRFIYLAIFIAIAVTATAQDYEEKRAGHLSTELQFNPFSNDFKTFKMGELKFRYFLDDKNAVRFSVGFGMDSQSETNTNDYNNQAYTPNNYRISSEETETTTNKSSLKLKLGYERHIDIFDRLSVYVGGEAGYEAYFYSGDKNVNGKSDKYKSNKYNWTNYDYWPYTTYEYTAVEETHTTTTGNYNYEKCTPDESNSNSHSIIANVFTGIDFQLYKGLYIGSELGLSFKMGKTEKGTYNYELNSRTNYSLNYSGNFPNGYKNESSTSTTYEKFDSSTGIRESKTTYSGSSSIPETSYSTAEVKGHTSKFSKIALYVEPALRIGWRF